MTMLVRNQTKSLVFFTIFPLIYCVHQWVIKRKKDEASKLSGKIRPPFPPVIRKMLSSCRLAYLSTVEKNSSHLSLMRFTFIHNEDDGEIIIMTTNVKTKKFNLLQKQDGVALLIHDFPQFEGSNETSVMETRGVHSITLNGNCEILNNDEKADRYRAKHLENNPDYPQFIVGDDIAVLCVNITSARICNINDQVKRWSIKDSR